VEDGEKVGFDSPAVGHELDTMPLAGRPLSPLFYGLVRCLARSVC
jgi:hypothetical protein